MSALRTYLGARGGEGLEEMGEEVPQEELEEELEEPVSQKRRRKSAKPLRINESDDDDA